MTEPDAASQVPDFTIRREPHRFTIDDDTFSSPPILSAVALKRFAADAATVSDVGALNTLETVVKAIEVVGLIMSILMPGASGQRFRERLESEGGEDQPTPIDLVKQALPAMYYLMECHGLRPTVPSSPLSPGLTDGRMTIPSDGTSSTAGLSPAESTSPVSALPTGSI